MLSKDDLKNISLIVKSEVQSGIAPLKKDIGFLREDFVNFTIVVKNQFDRVEENIEELRLDMKEVKTDIKALTKIQTNQYHLADKHTDDIRLLKTKLKLI